MTKKGKNFKKSGVIFFVIFEIMINFAWLGFVYLQHFCSDCILLNDPANMLQTIRLLNFNQASQQVPFRQSVAWASQLFIQSVILSNVMQATSLDTELTENTFNSIFICLVSVGPFPNHCSFCLFLQLFFVYVSVKLIFSICFKIETSMYESIILAEA